MNIIIKFITTLFNLYIVFYHNKKIIRSMNLEKNATVLDIGSHESELYKSLKAMKIEIVRYIAFEPVEKLYNNLLKQHKFNSNFEVINFALSNEKTVKKIEVNSISSTNTFSKINKNKLKYKFKNILTQFSSNETRIEMVQCEKLDNLDLNITNNLNLIKIDTEGHELEVIQGGLAFFKKYKPRYLVIEFQKDNYLNYKPDRLSELIKN